MKNKIALWLAGGVCFWCNFPVLANDISFDIFFGNFVYSQWLLFEDELLKVDDNVVATGRCDPGQASGVVRVGVGKARAGDHSGRAKTQVTTQGDVPVARVFSFWGGLRFEFGRLGRCKN